MPTYGGEVGPKTHFVVYTPLPHTCRICSCIEGKQFEDDVSLDESARGVSFVVEVNGRNHRVFVRLVKSPIPFLSLCQVVYNGEKVNMRNMNVPWRRT